MVYSDQVKIVERMTRRFKLLFGAFPVRLNLFPTILPVTSTDELLRETKIGKVTGLDLSGSGLVVAFTVPEGKRWTVYQYMTSTTAAGSEVVIADPDGEQTQVTATTTTSAFVNLSQPWILKERWTINRDSTGDVGDANESMEIMYLEEDAF